MFLIITLSIVFLQTHSSFSIELDRNRLDDSNFEEEILIDSQPKAPFWLKPKQMEREVFAEPLNSQVKLKCEADGEPSPSIQWLKDDLPIEKAKRPINLRPYFERPERWQLTIPGMIELDEGNYTCIVQNSKGILRHTFKIEALIYLTHKPVLIDQSDNLTVVEGMDATLFCKFQSDLAIFTKWLRTTRKDFDPKDPKSFKFLEDKNQQPFVGEQLTIEKVQLNDSGLIICAGQTNSGMTPGFLSLKVLSKSAAIVEKPTNVSVTLGSDAVFSCKTHKSLKNFISWSKVTESGIVRLEEGSEVLHIHNVTENDLGSYACMVGSEKAQVTEVAFLDLLEPSMTSTIMLNSKKLQWVAISVSILTIFLIIFVSLLSRKFWRERKKKQQVIANAAKLTYWTKKVIIERPTNNESNSSAIVAPIIRIEKQTSTLNRSRLSSENTILTNISEYELPLDPCWEWPRSELKFGQQIGEGKFGRVFKAKVSLEGTMTTATSVAVKMLKDGHTDSDMIDLVSEMDMMKMIGKHEHIINLLGVCTQDGPLYVIVEFAEHGNLRDYLKKHNHVWNGYLRPNSERKIISERTLVSFARQVCDGMDYLHSMKCIHRDLAARNILVSANDVIKIADFGLARDVHGNDYYRKTEAGCLPVKWMSPEALFHSRYTTKSDVWSFGVLLWEIMTLGGEPYTGVSYERLFQLLQMGFRMEKPTNCSRQFYQMMNDCWNAEPSLRPTFLDLQNRLEEIEKVAKDGDFLDLEECSTETEESTVYSFCKNPDQQIYSDSFETFSLEGNNYSISNSHTNMTYLKQNFDSILSNNNEAKTLPTSTPTPTPTKRFATTSHSYVNQQVSTDQQKLTKQNLEKESFCLNDDYVKPSPKLLQCTQL